MTSTKGETPNPLTPADVEAFHGYMRKWQSLLNLRDWRIEAGTKRSKMMAEVTFNTSARLATYKVGENFGAQPVTPLALEETALHELLHVVLYDLLRAVGTDASVDELDAREHAVINLLEKLLMPAYQGAPA